jgi:hypothetical protein
MADLTSDAGTLQALLDRLVKVRLPRTMEIKQRVERGQRLSDIDIAFLKEVLEDANTAQRYIVRNPEFRTVASGLVELYEEIVHKAVDNEKDA